MSTRTDFRPRLLPWSVLLGVLLLAGSGGGAWLALHSPALAQSSDGRSYESLDRRAVAVAFVDVEGGIVPLYPVRQGQVVDLPATEDREVAEGAALLRVDDALPKIELAEAKLALDAARKRLEQAKTLAAQHARQIEAQKAAIAAAQSKKTSAQALVKKAQRYKKERIGGTTEEDVTAAQTQVKEAEAGVRAEQAKLALLEAQNPQLAVDLAEVDIRAKQQQVDKAQLGIDRCVLKAPCKGKVLRKLVAVGETLGANPRQPALQFCPSKPRIIRAEVEQEFAGRVSVGMKARIEDDATSGVNWQGEVIRVSDWYTNRRSMQLEPLQFNDVRTLEVIIRPTPDPKNPLRIGQRVRVTLEGGK